MLDSLNIGTSGLQSFSTGLKVISNNVANLNTPGFKAGDAQFSSLYAGGGQGSLAGGGSGPLIGNGVMAGQTFVNFQPGDTRQTGNTLDLSIDGDGFFVTQGEQEGDQQYTRAGQFEFDKDGQLVLRGTGRRVLGLGVDGAQSPITLQGLRISQPKSTTQIRLIGNLSSSATEFSIASVKVIDAVGGEHVLKLVFRPKAGASGTWTVELLDGSSSVGSGEVRFADGRPAPGADSIDFSYTPAGGNTSSIKLDLSKDVTSFETGSTSSLAVGSTDGYSVGSLSKISFEADGSMLIAYSNGQTAKGSKLALARFDSNEALQPVGGNAFLMAGTEGRHIGAAKQGGFGSIASSQIEGSNVDLATEFSDLIVMQRGYQAASRIVSTANEMLQELFDMKGSR